MDQAAIERGLARLEERREANVGKQIDNGLCPAGSPMYYYCRSCGVLVATKPENWIYDPPPVRCGDCRSLVDAQAIDETNTLDRWARERAAK
jgi:hypothetical protein